MGLVSHSTTIEAYSSRQWHWNQWLLFFLIFTTTVAIHSKFLWLVLILVFSINKPFFSITWSSCRTNYRTTSKPIQLSNACCWMGSWRRRHVRVCCECSDERPIPIPKIPLFSRQELRSLRELAHLSGCLTGASPHAVTPIPCRIPIPYLPITTKKSNSCFYEMLMFTHSHSHTTHTPWPCKPTYSVWTRVKLVWMPCPGHVQPGVRFVSPRRCTESVRGANSPSGPCVVRLVPSCVWLCGTAAVWLMHPNYFAPPSRLWKRADSAVIADTHVVNPHRRPHTWHAPPYPGTNSHVWVGSRQAVMSLTWTAEILRELLLSSILNDGRSQCQYRWSYYSNGHRMATSYWPVATQLRIRLRQ